MISLLRGLRSRAGVFRPCRAWFADNDGTYIRNCPVIHGEIGMTHLAPGYRAMLHDEWKVTFSRGCQRKHTLDPGDVVVTMAPFRDSYPNEPGLWILDDYQGKEPPEPCDHRYEWHWDVAAGQPASHPQSIWAPSPSTEQGE